MARYKSVHTGAQIDSGVERVLPGGEIDLSLSNKANQADVDASLSNNAEDHPHRNLLDNWDFRNPVNQRGQTSYAGGVYTIDRFGSSGGTVTVNDNSITYANSTGQGDGYFHQRLENSENYKGLTLTVSVNFLSGSSTKFASLVCYRPTSPGYVIYIGNVVTNGGVSTVTGVVPADTTFIEVRAEIGGGVIGVMTIETMKLELGSVSTLANDPPADFGAELTRCKRYFNLWASEAARTAALLEVGAMRTTPVLSTIDIGGVTYYTASADL